MVQTLIQRIGEQYNIIIRSPEQFKNGYTLMNIALKILYRGTNPFLEAKLAEAQANTKSTSPLANSSKAGNNVLIINSLLKHIKSDNNIDKQTWVKELTFYNLLENQDILHNFINWMIDTNHNSNPNSKEQPSSHQQNQQQTLPMKHKKSLHQNIYQEMTEEQINSMSSNRFRNLQIENNPKFKTEQPQPQNEFDNLYFASNLKSKPMEQPLIISPEKGDKIVRKGSFKLLKPKVTFTDDSVNSHPSELPQLPKNHSSKPTFSQNQTSKLSNFYQPDELKEISMIEPSNNQQAQNISHHQNLNQHSSQIFQSEEFHRESLTQTPLLNSKQAQIQNRKTIPKNLSKPPMCRSSSRKNKQNLQNGPSDKEKTVQQSIKKKNFFNFSQNQDIVSTFNYQLESKEHQQNGFQVNTNEQENYGSTSRSKVFSKIKDLNSHQNEQIKQYMSFESQQLNNNNIIEENDYTVTKSSQVQKGNTHKQSSQFKSIQQPNENRSKLIKLKNHFLQNQVYDLQKQINKEQSSLHQLQHCEPLPYSQPNNYQSGHKRSITSLQYDNRQIAHVSINKNTSFDSTKKSNRKVSKIQLLQLEGKDKQMVIDWLDSLHFIDKAKSSHDDVFQKFKDGTRFVELCNHYIGRGKTLPYFSNPKKNAQIHSNYSKVFEYLKTYSQWDHPQLLFAYELFVPYPQENSVWNLLFGIFKLLTKKGKNVNKSASKQQSLIFTKELQSSRKKSVQKQFQMMEENPKNQESIQKPLDFNLNINQQTSRKSTSSRKQSTFTKPIEFVREIPQNLKRNDLVQQDEENESTYDSDQYRKQNEVNVNVYFEGYKDRYMRKNIHNSSSQQKSKYKSLQTPKKWNNQPHQNQQSFIYPYGQSINKGSIRKSSSKKILQNQLKKIQNSSCKQLSTRNSLRQNQKTKPYPKISLNMQMKVEKILRHFGLNKLLDDKNGQKLVNYELLQDPIRNGTLVNVLLGRFVPAFQGKYVQTVKSIEHCRQNYMNFYALIKNKYGQEGFEMVEKYLDLTEDILRGEKTLFYGVAYSLIQLMEKKGFKTLEQNNTSKVDNQPLGTYRVEREKAESMIDLYSRNQIEWIRYLERSNPRIVGYKIRSVEDLRKSINSGLFLYAFSENSSMKPVYTSPSNQQERQANLKKILCYMIQNKIVFDREDFSNVKAIAQSSIQVVDELINKLVRYTVDKYGLGTYRQSVVLSVNNENDYIGSNQIGTHSKEMTVPQNNNSKPIALGKYLQENGNEFKHPSARLQTTTAEYINETYFHANHHYDRADNPSNNRQFPRQQEQRPEVSVEIPWMRKLGFMNCSLSINNGIMLCRLISKLTRTNIKFNENISNDARIPKAQSLGYIRKAIRLIPSFKFDEIDIYEADSGRTLQVYEMIKEKFRNTYQLTKILCNK